MKKLFNYFLENKVSLLVRAFISAIFVFIDITLLKNSLFDKVLDKNFIDILNVFFVTGTEKETYRIKLGNCVNF